MPVTTHGGRSRWHADRVKVEKDVMVPGPDGVLLATDIFHPEGDGPHPTLVQRTCYGKDFMAPWIGVTWMAEQGYRVVFQDCRGSGNSTGEADIFAEARDGRALVDWLPTQDWYDGTFGTFGMSYMGFTQWALASTDPPGLKAMAIGEISTLRHATWFPGGSFALDIAIPWSRARAIGVGDLMDQDEAAAKIKAGLDHLPLGEADTVAIGYSVPWYQDWMNHPTIDDPFWEPLDFRSTRERIDVPIIFFDGWYDYPFPYLLDDWRVVRDRGVETRLVVGPWAHPEVDQNVVGPAQLAWFDKHLRGRDVDTGAPVSVFVTPDAGWRDLADWPPPSTPQTWRLPEGEPTRFTYDPADPTPAFGGISLQLGKGGSVDNRELEARDDVVAFDFDPFDTDVELAGPVQATIYVSCDAPSVDLFVRLCDVSEDGTSMNFTDAIRRLGAVPEPTAVTLDLWPVHRRMAAGHRLRVQISGGAHPLFARNTCSGEPLAKATTLVRASVAVHHDTAHPSAVVVHMADS